MDRVMTFRSTVSRVAVMLALGAAALPTAAQAWWRGGVVIGVAPPRYYPPPVYVPPPVYYYAPPPVIYAPPPFYVAPPSQYARRCYAGPYICPLQPPGPAGSLCSCPANQGRAYGRAG